MTDDMKRRCQDPLFAAGLVAMAKQYHLLKTNPSKLLSAVHTFGKSGSLTSKRATSLRRAARRQGPVIGCQPTAVARRKSGSGSKRRLSAGRPVKRHSLSSSVTLNTSLAKKHWRTLHPLNPLLRGWTLVLTPLYPHSTLSSEAGRWFWRPSTPLNQSPFKASHFTRQPCWPWGRAAILTGTRLGPI